MTLRSSKYECERFHFLRCLFFVTLNLNGSSGCIYIEPKRPQKRTFSFPVCTNCNGVFTLPDTETETEIDKKWVVHIYRIVWRCSHCTETDDNADSHWALCTYSRSQYPSLMENKLNCSEPIWKRHRYYSGFCSMQMPLKLNYDNIQQYIPR